MAPKYMKVVARPANGSQVDCRITENRNHTQLRPERGDQVSHVLAFRSIGFHDPMRFLFFPSLGSAQ